MPAACLPDPATLLPTAAARPGLRVGLDSVAVAEVADALNAFGARYLQRVFTDEEAAYALAAPACTAERLAARFAAKEAVIKVLNLGEAGVAWRDIGVQRGPDGAPRLVLRGRAAEALARLGPCDTALSLSHDPLHACAVVVLLPRADCSASVPAVVPTVAPTALPTLPTTAHAPRA